MIEVEGVMVNPVNILYIRDHDQDDIVEDHYESTIVFVGGVRLDSKLTPRELAENINRWG